MWGKDCCCSSNKQSLGPQAAAVPEEGLLSPSSLYRPMLMSVLSVLCHFWVNIPLQLWALAPPYCPER